MWSGPGNPGKLYICRRPMSISNQWSTTGMRIDQVSNKNITKIPGLLAVSSVGSTHSVPASATVIRVVLEVVTRSITACQAGRALEHNLVVVTQYVVCGLTVFPQAPQLLWLVRRLVHAPLQQVKPDAHCQVTISCCHKTCSLRPSYALPVTSRRGRVASWRVWYTNALSVPR